MKLDQSQIAEVKKKKTEIAREYGATSFEDIDRGNLTSRSNGDITRAFAEMEELPEAGDAPKTVKNQNLGHNSKKEGLGPNTKR